MRLISVVIGAPNSQTRFNECSKLFNYGFANYENKKIVNMDEVLKNLPVNKGKKENVDLYASENFSVVSKKGESKDYQVSFDVPSKVNAPCKEGDNVGKVIVSQDGQIVKEINLILKENIEKLSLKDCFDKVVSNW